MFGDVNAEGFFFEFEEFFVVDFFDFAVGEEVDGGGGGGAAERATEEAHLAGGGGVMGFAAVGDDAVKGVEELGRRAPRIEDAGFNHIFEGTFADATEVDTVGEILEAGEGAIFLAFFEDEVESGFAGVFDGAEAKAD